MVESALKEQRSGSASKPDYSDLDRKREVEARYGKEISRIVKDYNLNPSAYDFLIKRLIRLGDEYAGDFVDGFGDFMKDGKRFLDGKDNSHNLNMTDVANMYVEGFDEAMEALAEREQEAKTANQMLLMALACFVIALIGFITVPLLIQIERNTRRVSAQA